VGEVLGITEDGRLRVKFPNGTWNFKRNQLVAAVAAPVDGISVGSSVTWTSSDADIPTGHKGEVLGITEDGRLRVKFPNGTWKFRRNQLVAAAAQPASQPGPMCPSAGHATGRNIYRVVQGAHLNPLGPFLTHLGLFLRTFKPFIWRVLIAFLPT